MKACYRWTATQRWAAILALVALAPNGAAGAESDATVALLGTCVACHGADGIGKAPQYPNLRGQKAAYTEKQLKAFRSGERQDSNMGPLARVLSDEDIAVLAAYFAAMDETCSEPGAAP